MPKNKLLFLSVFVCGAVVMIFELAGSRIMAPYFGSSIFVWTGIIGVVMGSLALGYWLGGRIADRGADAETYSRVIFFSGVAIFWSFLAKDAVPALFQDRAVPIELGSLLAAIVIFMPASVLLGIVSPYAVRLKLHSMETSASTVGNLYAASTVGSISGTFAAGYLLIPHLGAANIFFVLVVILGALSFLFSKKHFTAKAAALAILAASFLLISSAISGYEQGSGQVRIDTEYNAIRISPGTHEETGREVLDLSFDPFARQSSMFLESDELVWDYTKFYRLAKHFVPDIRKSLMIGGGAYSYPKDYLRDMPHASIDVVEIDPGITQAAKRYFRLPDDPRLSVYHEDARVFLNDSKEKYDVIYDDAFTSALTIPFQLTTKEAVERQYDMLNDGGAVVANIGGSLGGKNSRFLAAEYATFKSVFPQVHLFPVADASDESRIQNIMLVALKSEKPASFSSDDPELSRYLSHLYERTLSLDLPILTDDFAPVEYYMKSLI
jgi:spermidine synthase